MLIFQVHVGMFVFYWNMFTCLNVTKTHYGPHAV